MENKKEIVSALAETIKKTHYGQDIETMDYEKVPTLDDEFVVVRFRNGHVKRIDVTGDSGISICRDVLNHLD